MKKIVLMLAMFSAVAGFNSCKKCAECSNCPLGASPEFCVDDYSSKDDYNAAVANAKALGCDCKEKLKTK
ncbi:MAG: hypothetical protein GC178_10830 [Flavobacteriales bacterium]|nr:hypothetical protein [Flavobacteriales bacterium]